MESRKGRLMKAPEWAKSKEDALHEARRRERSSEQRHYVGRTFEGTWWVTSEMPLLGEWYDSDGIRHG